MQNNISEDLNELVLVVESSRDHTRRMGSELPFRGYNLRVLQASGMVSSQAECTVADALARMMNRAEATDQTMEKLADAILERSVQLGAL